MVKTYVYRNLHQKCWSLRERGLVVDHQKILLLHNVEFKVRESGRQRVLRDKQKNAHAFAVGDVQVSDISEDMELKWLCALSDMRQVTYNPYKNEYFRIVVNWDGKNNTPIYINYSSWVLLCSNGDVWARNPDWRCDL